MQKQDCDYKIATEKTSTGNPLKKKKLNKNNLRREKFYVPVNDVLR